LKFSPGFKCFSFDLNKTPPKWDPPLSVQEGFDISFLKYYLLPLLNTIRYQFEIYQFEIYQLKISNFKIGGGAVVRSFCFGLIFSPPLAWIAKNGIIRALVVLSSPLVINKWVKIVPKRRSPFALSPKDGEWLRVTAKGQLRSGSLCLRRRLQFPFNTPMTWFEIDLKNTLVIAYERDMIKGI
jgi:hypothetical protein